MGNLTYAYDAAGRRMGKTVNGAMTQFLYDGLNPVQELDGAAPANVTANLLTGLGIDEYFTRSDSSGTMAFMADAPGSTIGLVNAAGGIDTSYAYQPFGATTVNGTNANPYQFTGRENDGAGLYFYRARYYSPTFQRFIAQDPIGFAGGDANLYAYTRNAPTVWSDPLGWWIGQYPPPPPGSGGWGPPTQFPNGKWYLTDPSGTKWVAHPEDPKHWCHWDQQPPGGGKNRPWPPNSRKPRSNQNQCRPDQSPTDPSGDAPEWQPLLSPDPNSNMSVPVVPFDFPGLPPIEIPEIPLIPVPVF